jgi:hypothetical protein
LKPQQRDLTHVLRRPVEPAPNQRTLSDQPTWSVWCQRETHAPQRIVKLFDHFVGELLQLRGHVKAESLRGFDVDDQPKLGRLFDR